MSCEIKYPNNLHLQESLLVIFGINLRFHLPGDCVTGPEYPTGVFQIMYTSFYFKTHIDTWSIICEY